jgi:UMF1 family MFS transporter
MSCSAGGQRGVIAWAFYDWANSAFATTVMAGFFPIFFKQFWSSGVAVTESTFRLGLANSLASILVACLAPFLGTLADRSGAKKGFLLFFAAMGIIMTGALYLVAMGNWVLALLLYGMGLVGFSGSNIFYDALLVVVTDKAHYDRVSSLGFSLGYLGGGLLFAGNVLMISFPDWFGLSGQAEAVRISFLTVAVWWALFSIPLLLFVREPDGAAVRGRVIRDSLRQLRETFHQLRQLRMTFLFLLAYWCYIDGVDTIVRMAVDYGLSIGLQADNLMAALLITQFVGFPAALLFGRLGERYGTKQGIMLAILAYLLILQGAYRMESIDSFYLLAGAIGLVQGGIQALSRSLYARMIPHGQAGEFFGFYNMLGKFAVVLGPLLMGAVGLFTESSRVGMLSVSLLFIVGASLLYFVDVAAGRQAAERLGGD